MQTLLCRGLLLAAVFSLITCSEVIPSKIGKAHKLEKRSTGKREEEQPLPRYVTPNSYMLELLPLLHETQFGGEVEINITCHEPTDRIVLHADSDLQVEFEDSAIHSIGLWDESPGRSTFRKIGGTHHYERVPLKYSQHSVTISTIKRNSDKDWLEIVLNEKLKKGMMYLVKLEFLGNVSMKEEGGLCRKNYTTSETKKDGWFMVADINKKNARKLFPCFDDPSFKAIIQLRIVLPSSLKALSTMPLQSTETVKNGWRMDHFSPTPPIAVQSLGIFIIDTSHFMLLAKEKVNDFTVNTYGQASIKSKCQPKIKEINSYLKMIQRYTSISFPLPELNLVVIPTDDSKWNNYDFWGLIPFSERYLEEENFLFIPLSVLPNQWVEHLVTPDTQTVSYGVGLRLYIIFYVIDAQQRAENLNRFIWSTYIGPDLYASIYRNDQWTSNLKISWMLSMLNNTLTEESFRLGIHSFIHEKSFKTYSEDDLFEALNNQAWLDGVLPLSMSVREIAKSWIDNRLFPIVTLKRNYEENSALIQQHAFISKYRANQTQEMKDHLFWVPIMFMTSKNMDISSMKLDFWMKERQRYINDLPGEDTFIIVNPEHAGMYWVNYDQTNWHLISEYLLKSATDRSLAPIPEVSRTKLLYDAVMLAAIGELDFSTALNMTLFLTHERDPNPLMMMFNVFQQLSSMLHETPVYDKLLTYFKHVCVPVYEHFRTVELKGYFKQMFLTMITSCAQQVGYEPALAEAKKNFRLFLANNLQPQGWSACAVLQWSDEDWELALQYALANIPTNETSDMNYFHNLISCPKNPKKLERVLYLMFIDKQYEFSDKDVKDVFYDVNDYETLLMFILDHWNEIKSRYGNNPQMWNFLFEKSTKQVKTDEGLKLVSQLYEKHHTELKSAKTLVETALKNVRESLNGEFKHLKEIETWLDLHLPSLSTV